MLYCFQCSSVWQASDLIQQGVYEGEVNLLIASMGHLSPQFRSDHMGLAEWRGEEVLESTGHREGDSRNMIKDIPEGILLKKKKKMRMSAYTYCSIIISLMGLARETTLLLHEY